MASQRDLPLEVTSTVVELLGESSSGQESLLIEKLVTYAGKVGAAGNWLIRLQAEPSSVTPALPSLLDEFLLFFFVRQFSQGQRFHGLLSSDYDTIIASFDHWEDRIASDAALMDQLQEYALRSRITWREREGLTTD